MKLLESLHNYDLHTFDWCLRRKHLATLTTASRWLSKTADGHLYVIGALVLIICDQQLMASVLTLALCAERLLYFVLKNNFKRNRPPQAIPGFKSVVEPSDQFSFPSGHTSAAFLCATLVCQWLPEVGGLLYLWAGLVGVSRVLLGVHFPTDTLAGAALGHSIAVLALTLV